MYSELAEKTHKLIAFCDESLNRLDNILVQEQYEPDFFNAVKPFVDEVMEIADEWKDLAEEWIKKERPKNLHSNQIDATHENIQHISIQGFYKDTKIKRYKAMYESVQYVLRNIIEKLNS